MDFLSLAQQAPAQQAPEHTEARKFLENLQATERKKQQLQFQLQQVHLNLQQAKASLAMEQEFRKTMKIQVDQHELRSQPIKLVLRKR